VVLVARARLRYGLPKSRRTPTLGAFETQAQGSESLATAGLTVDEQQAVERFRKDVVEPSMSKLVVLDFWAEWCGPCKALAPTLEKVSGEYADKGVILAKLNVDEEPFIAAQFQVRSIPTVYAMFQGRPVADLTSARAESQLRQALDELLRQLPVQAGDAQAQADVEQFVAMAEQVLAEGDGERAAGIFAQVVEMAPDNAAAHAGLVRALIAAGQIEDARAALTAVPEALAADPAIASARSALELAADRPDDSELQTLRALAAEAPADQQKQFDFAAAAFAAGSRDEAAETLLRMIEVDPEWNEGAAKAKLLQIFEAVGLEDPWVAGNRRRLSLLLFG
jgi:putative thioredoxin